MNPGIGFSKHILPLKRPAGTSRGVLTEKSVFFLYLWDKAKPSIYGIGECGLMPGLSAESPDDVDKMLREISLRPKNFLRDPDTALSGFPTVRFALETAQADLSNGGKGIIFPSKFTAGAGVIETNALIWMGDEAYQRRQIKAKLLRNPKCVKLKIGINFQSECRLIEYIRELQGGRPIEIRVDANGAYTADNVFGHLNALSRYDVHSIEQPVKKGNHGLMAKVINRSPIPVALDEELIGVAGLKNKSELLDGLRPNYLVLKPGLLGGFKACDEWVSLCESRNIGFWITSALEGNVGLNAVSQWAYGVRGVMCHGLGTGTMYKNNVRAPIRLNDKFELTFRPNITYGFANVGKPVFDEFRPKSVSVNDGVYTLRPNNAKASEYKKFLKKLNGLEDLPEYAKIFVRAASDWHSGNKEFIVSTSGSTGKPKPIAVHKKQAEASALRTLRHLKIEKGSRFLLCLPANHIAGMMVYVRAVLSQGSLALCSPNVAELNKIKGCYDLASMVPTQLSACPDMLNKCGTILLGGAPVSDSLKKIIRRSTCAVYETFGMTETVSHIALKNISESEHAFTVLPDIVVTAKNGMMLVSDRATGVNDLLTNDIIRMTGKTSFEWLGRFDDVINSGGRKLHPEAIKKKMASFIPEPFVITGIPHAKLGEVPAVLILSDKTEFHMNRESWKQALRRLTPAETPRYIGFTKCPPLKGTCKINRSELPKNIDYASVNLFFEQTPNQDHPLKKHNADL